MENKVDVFTKDENTKAVNVMSTKIVNYLRKFE